MTTTEHPQDRPIPSVGPDPYPDVSLPPGAVDHEGWADAGTPDAFRIVIGPSHGLAQGCFVQAVGMQRPDGSLQDAYVRTTLHGDDELSAGDARSAAEAFIKAATEIELWETMWSL